MERTASATASATANGGGSGGVGGSGGGCSGLYFGTCPLMTLTPHTDAVSCIALSEFNNKDSDGHNSNSTNTGIRGIFIVTGSDDANVGVMFLASPPHPDAMLGRPPPMHMLGIQRPLVLHMLCGHDDLITGVAVAAGT
jgi:hypothetical protein